MLYGKINGKNASKLVMGTDYHGTAVDKKTAFMLYDAFYDAGGNNFDTANMYTDGLSEEILGSWVRTKCRDEIFVSSKGGQPKHGGMRARLSYDALKQDIEQSLTRSKLDYFDIYWLHRDDMDTPVGEIVEGLNIFIEEGKTKSIGCSNWRAERLALANSYAEARGLKGFCASQIKWSLAKTSPHFADDPTLVEMDDNELEFYEKNNFKVFAYASQGKGFFSKYMEGGEENLSPKAKERYLCEENLRRFEVLSELAKEKRTTAAAITLSYLLCMDKCEAFPIIGCKTKDQLADSLNAVNIQLTPEEIRSFI